MASRLTSYTFPGERLATVTKDKGCRIRSAGWGRNGDGPGAGPNDGQARSGPLFRPKTPGCEDA